MSISSCVEYGSIWLALNIGNSRLHWGWFTNATLCCTWDTNHLSAASVSQVVQRWTAGDWTGGILPPNQISFLRGGKGENPQSMPPLYIASVVPSQTELWQIYPNTRVVTLDQIPLPGIYPTLGIDRALAVLGAGRTLGWPVMVIDAGTALTFTGADAQGQLIGGAILPGLGLQLESLKQKTAALPKIKLPEQIPLRWALNTPTAIQSGIIYTFLAGINDFSKDWWRQFPESQIALTGGDHTSIYTYLQVQYPEIASKLVADSHLIFWGMRSLVVRSQE